MSLERTLVSRAESLDLVGSRVLEGWSVNVLQRLAEVDPGGDVDEARRALTEFQGTNEGLHAKTYVFDVDGSRSIVVTGSANLTSDQWGSNVEFDAVLEGPTAACGVHAILDGSSEAPGLNKLLEGYSVVDEDGVTDAAIETSYSLERFHQQLAVNAPNLHVTTVDEVRVEATLTLTVPTDPPGRTRVWPASLSSDTHSQPLSGSLVWTMAPISITPFIALESTHGQGDARVTRRCVLKATLTGAVGGRRHDAVFSILRSKQDVLRYLVFLLGDPSYDALFAQLAGVDGDGFSADLKPWLGVNEVALFEPLVRAAGRDEDALARVASLVEELREMEDGNELVPDGFDELWDVVWQVHRERLS